MSTRQTGRAWAWRHAIGRSDLPPTTRAVLWAISLFMNSEGRECFPTIEKLVDVTGLSNRAVIDHIHLAADRGWLEVSARKLAGMRWRGHQYEAGFPEGGEGGSPARPLRGGEGGSPALDAKAVNLVPKGGEPNDKRVVREIHSILPDKDSNNAPGRGGARGRARNGAVRSTQGCRQISKSGDLFLWELIEDFTGRKLIPDREGRTIVDESVVDAALAHAREHRDGHP